MVSPHGDDGTEQQSFAHNWEYYMNGAFGEELIQYSGFQTVKESDGDIGRRVYLSVNKFNATSDLHIRRDGIKEVYFTDNNGNVRVVIDSNNNIKKYEYKPFGELYWSSDGSHLREGLDGSIFDPESELQMKGVRMYDTETGRFTTPDLLWSAFPSHTPYHYAYNSPLIWSDPSGLAPEKERDREKLLNIEIEEERAECGYEILDRKQNEIKNSSKNQTSNSGSRDGNEGSAPGDLSAGIGRGISNLLSEYTDNTQTAMFSTLLAQHLDVGLTDGLSLSGPPNMGSGSSHHRNTNLSPNPNDKGNKIIQKKSKMSDFDKWFSNVSTAFEMTLKWFTGIHGTTESNYFYNDIVANAMRNARKVNEARDYFYNKYKGKTDLEGASVIAFRGTFGLMGLFKAGLDPIEQFVGSCKINIYLHDDYLQFNIINRTSLTSALYHLWPNSWNWSQGPMGNYDQVFIFTEPINFKRLSGK